MKQLLTTITFLLVITISANFATAQTAKTNDSIYEVKDVAINVNDLETEAAKKEAITRAGRKAFQALLESRAGIYDPKAFSDKQIDNAVQSFTLRKEEFGELSYSAIFTIRFSRNQFDRLIVSNVIQDIPTPPPANNRPKINLNKEAILIIPVMVSDHKLKTWQEKNQWHDLWHSMINTGRITNFITLTRGGSEPDVTNLLKTVLVVDGDDASYVKDLTSGQVLAQKIIAKYNIKSLVITLITLAGTSIDGSLIYFQDQSSAEKIHFASVDDNFDATLLFTLKQMVQRINSKYNTQTSKAINGDNFILRINITTHEEFTDIIHKLTDILAPNEPRTLEINSNSAIVSIHFADSLTQLIRICASSGLQLVQKSNGMLYLSLKN